MPGHEFVLNSYPVTDRERLWRSSLSTWTNRTRQRKRAIDKSLEFLASDDSLFDKKRCDGGQMALIVRCIDVVPGRHSLDRMPELIHVVNVTSQREGRKRANNWLPRLVVRQRGVCHTPKALPASEVMHAVHGLYPVTS